MKTEQKTQLPRGDPMFSPLRLSTNLTPYFILLLLLLFNSAQEIAKAARRAESAITISCPTNASGMIDLSKTPPK